MKRNSKGGNLEIFWDEIPVFVKEYLKVVDITDKVQGIVGKRGVREGSILVYNPHVTSAVTINEADPELWDDLLEAYQRLVPLRADYKHNAKYRGIPREENAHAHILNTFIGQSVTIPIEKGELLLGTWQAILYIELDGGKKRNLIVQTAKVGGE